MASQGGDSEHRPRENDHLVEPMYSGLGLNQEHCGSPKDGSESDSDVVDPEVPFKAAPRAGGSVLRAIADRMRRWWKGPGL